MTDRGDWQQALQDAAGVLDARDLERAEAEAREAERAETAALWAACPEPVVTSWVRGDRESIYSALMGHGVSTIDHPIRDEAVRLWKAAWVERERASRMRQRASAPPSRLSMRVAIEGVPHESVSEPRNAITDRKTHNQAGTLEVVGYFASSADFEAAIDRTLDLERGQMVTAAMVEIQDEKPPERRIPQVGDVVECLHSGEGVWLRTTVDAVNGRSLTAIEIGPAERAPWHFGCAIADGEAWRWPEAQG